MVLLPHRVLAYSQNCLAYTQILTTRVIDWLTEELTRATCKLWNIFLGKWWHTCTLPVFSLFRKTSSALLEKMTTFNIKRAFLKQFWSTSQQPLLCTLSIKIHTRQEIFLIPNVHAQILCVHITQMSVQSASWKRVHGYKLQVRLGRAEVNRMRWEK